MLDVRERVDGVRNHVRQRGELVRPDEEQPSHVERHVAVADDDGALVIERRVQVDPVGVPVVPVDEVRGRVAAAQLLARNLQCPALGRAGGVDDAVMMLEQLVMGHVAPDLDVEPQGNGLPSGEVLEHARHLLGVEVVRSDAVPDQAVGRRQPIEERDLDLGAPGAGELVGKEPTGRTGADDSHAERLGLVFPLGSRRRVRHRCRDVAHPREVVGVDLQVVAQVVGNLEVRVHGADRAGVDARAAVDALVRMDVEHLGRGELRLVRRRVDAVDRAHLDARGVVATRLGDDVGHRASTLLASGGGDGSSTMELSRAPWGQPA